MIAQYGAVQHIAQQYAGSSEGCKVAQGAAISLACFKAGQGSFLLSARHPIQVFFAERTTGHVMCPLGYNKFDIFLENKEYRPFDGCKIEIYIYKIHFLIF